MVSRAVIREKTAERRRVSLCRKMKDCVQSQEGLTSFGAAERLMQRGEVGLDGCMECDGKGMRQGGIATYKKMNANRWMRVVCCCGFKEVRKGERRLKGLITNGAGRAYG